MILGHWYVLAPNAVSNIHSENATAFQQISYGAEEAETDQIFVQVTTLSRTSYVG
jgi:hypothetical protein